MGLILSENRYLMETSIEDFLKSIQKLNEAVRQECVQQKLEELEIYKFDFMNTLKNYEKKENTIIEEIGKLEDRRETVLIALQKVMSMNDNTAIINILKEKDNTESERDDKILELGDVQIKMRDINLILDKIDSDKDALCRKNDNVEEEHEERI